MIKRFFVLAALAMVALLLAACNFSTANIRSAELGKGYDSQAQKVTDPTTTFEKTDVFHCVVVVANAPEDTSVRFVWTAVDVVGMDGNAIKDTKIDEGTFTTKETGTVINATLNLPNSGQWPTGKYKVDIYLNDKLDRTLDFSVAE